MQLAALRPQEVNTVKLTLLFRKLFELCKVRADGTIAIVSALGMRAEYVQAAFASADELRADICVPKRTAVCPSAPLCARAHRPSTGSGPASACMLDHAPAVPSLLRAAVSFE